MTEGFTIAGATLSLLQVGEQGIITRIAQKHEPVARQLEHMGLVPGTTIAVEQRSPHYVIRVGQQQLTLHPGMAQTIYLRLQPAPRPTPFWAHLNQWAIACLKQISAGPTTAPQPVCAVVNRR